MFFGMLANDSRLTLRCKKDSREVMDGLKRQIGEVRRTQLDLRILKVDEFILEKRSLAGAARMTVRGQLQPDGSLNARLKEESDERWGALGVLVAFIMSLANMRTLDKSFFTVMWSIIGGAFVLAVVANIIVLHHHKQLALSVLREAVGAEDGTAEKWRSGADGYEA